MGSIREPGALLEPSFSRIAPHSITRPPAYTTAHSKRLHNDRLAEATKEQAQAAKTAQQNVTESSSSGSAKSFSLIERSLTAERSRIAPKLDYPPTRLTPHTRSFSTMTG